MRAQCYYFITIVYKASYREIRCDHGWREGMVNCENNVFKDSHLWKYVENYVYSYMTV